MNLHMSKFEKFVFKQVRREDSGVAKMFWGDVISASYRFIVHCKLYFNFRND